MYLGCHISVGKGLLQASQKAIELGAESFQVFSKNPRSLRPKKLDIQDAEQGRLFCQEHGLKVIVHTPYITNLSSPDAELQRLTIASLHEDLHISEAFGSAGAIVHCGKHVGEGEEKGFHRMVETLNLILSDYKGPVKLLLENTAGQGSEIGLTIEELMRIRNASDYPDKIGFCFDTCHAFAAGIWNDETYEQLIEAMIHSGYRDNLIAIHFNDSKAPYNSRKDRHEKIGKGEIGSGPLTKFLRDDRFNGLPIILETPADDEMEYKDEILYLRELQG